MFKLCGYYLSCLFLSTRYNQNIDYFYNEAQTRWFVTEYHINCFRFGGLLKYLSNFKTSYFLKTPLYFSVYIKFIFCYVAHFSFFPITDLLNFLQPRILTLHLQCKKYDTIMSFFVISKFSSKFGKFAHLTLTVTYFTFPGSFVL